MFEHPKTAGLVAAALEMPIEAVAPEVALGVSMAWTSLSHMRLILALEDEIGRRLSPDEIVGLSSAPDVDRLLLSQ